MVLKRKRSVTELSSSPSSVSSFNSPPQNLTDISNPFASIDLSPIHLHSRTMKRFRNSRPSEEVVHQRTLNMLYSAQQRHIDSMAVSEQHKTPQQPARPETNQQSLHRFWNISSAPPASSVPSHQVPSTTIVASNCDDCGTGLADSNGVDMMDMDNFDPVSHTCGACGKHVCFSCSVSNLGAQRRCLQCAGRNMQGRGTGWTSPKFSI